MTAKKTLEEALAEMEAKKSELADYKAKHALEFEAEIKRQTTLDERLASLSQSERRQVLDAAGLTNVSAAPAPLLSPSRDSASIPPNMRTELAAMAEQRRLGPSVSPQAAIGTQGVGGLNNPAPVLLQSPQPAEVLVVNRTVHKLERRRHALSAFIEKGRGIATDGADYLAVWPALVQLAEASDRPPEVLGYIEGEGIKYRSDSASNGIKFFSKKALKSMFEREAKAR